MRDRAVDSFPRRFGRYELTGLLGEGGMGRVYRATLTGPSGFRKELALKVIRAKDDSDPAAAVAAFIQEARVCGLLRHPNVVDVYDFGATDEQPWLAMEFIDGWPLDGLIAEQESMPPTVVLDVAIQVAEGLMHAHELTDAGQALALVHRDLKPGNVLVSRQGIAKVMDFGLARATRGDDALVSTGSVRGTPAYMSPEQAASEELDPRSDLFSFGVMLYELATGERPFVRDNVIALVMALIQVEDSLADPAFLGRAEERIAGIGPVLKGCLRRDPADRFDRTRTLVDALRNLLRAQPPGPSLRSWLDAVVLGNHSRASMQLGSLSVLGTPLPGGAPASMGPQGSVGTGFGGTAGAVALRSNLGPESSVFVGRGESLTALGALVDGGSRLVGIFGPAGTGKTRFARAYAQSRAEMYLQAGGLWFCDLSDATDLQGVLAAVASPLGVPLDQARGEAAALDQVGFAIVGRGRVVLIVDNAEHVLAQVGRALTRWMEIGGEALFLVTTRERLRLPGAAEIEIGPLDEEDAIQLFRARARAVRPDFSVTEGVVEVVARIVRRLDRIPLAIELAAARSGVLTPEQIYERLSERFKLLRARSGTGPERQATLHDAIEWSWNLLEGDEQAALAQCSVFRGSFDLDAVEAIVELDGGWALDAIEALRDKSLVRAEQVRELGGAMRFRLYESIRVFAAEQLDGAAQQAAWTRHAEHYLSWGEAEVGKLEGPGARSTRRKLSAELDNLHAVFARRAATHPAQAVRAALTMTPLLLVTGPLDGHVALLDRAVALAERLPGDAHDSQVLLARLLLVRGRMRTLRSRRDEAESDLARGLSIARDHADRRLEGSVLSALASVKYDRGAMAESRALGQELDALAVASADRVLKTEALWTLGRAAALSPDTYVEAERFLSEGLALSLELGLTLTAARITAVLALATAQTDKYARTTELFRQALALSEELGHRRGQASAVSNLALLSVRAGEFERADREVRRALKMQTRIGNRRSIGILRMTRATNALLLGDPETALVQVRKSVAFLTEYASPYYQGAALRTLGSILHSQGRSDEASEAYDKAMEALASDEGGFMVASVIGARAALAADEDDVLQADVLISEALSGFTDPAGLAFLSLCRGHVELAQARVYRSAGEAAEAGALLQGAQGRLARGGFPEMPSTEIREATNRVASLLLERAIARYVPGGP